MVSCLKRYLEIINGMKRRIIEYMKCEMSIDTLIPVFTNIFLVLTF